MYVYSYGGNVSGVLFLNNTVNATVGSGFYFVNGGSGAINVTDFIIRGNNIFAGNAGLNFSGLKTGSLVNVTVEYNRILSPVGVNITDFNDNSSFDFNWWGVNDITGKTLGIDTLNHFILNVTNLTSLDNVKFGNIVGFAFLVLNTSLVNEGVEYLPYFVVNGIYKYNNTDSQIFESGYDSGFTGNFTVFGDDYVQNLSVSLDDQDLMLIFYVESIPIIIVDSVSDLYLGNASYGDNFTVSGIVNSTYLGGPFASGIVYITIGNKTKSYVLNETGGFSITFNTTEIGGVADDYVVNVSYIGDSNYTAALNDTVKVNITKNADSSSVVNVIAIPDVVFGNSFTVSGFVTGVTTPTGNVTVKIYNGTVLVYTHNTNITLDHGVFTLVLNTTDVISGFNVSDSPFTVNVTYNGDNDFFGNYSAVNFNITKATPILTVNDTGNVVFGGNFTVIGNLTGVGVNVTGIVNVTIGDKTVTATLDSVNGNWSVEFNSTSLVSAGNYAVIVNYYGDGNYTAVANTNIVKIIRASSVISVTGDVKVYGDNATIGGSVTGVIGVIPTGVVNVTVGNVSVLVDINSTGEWVLTFNTTSVGNVGNYTINVTYTGDVNYTGSSNNAEYLNITKAASVLTVNNVDTIVFGENFTVSGIVTGVGATLEGSVNITIGNYSNANVQLNSDGTFNITLNSSLIGLAANETHTVTVTYNGGTNYNNSTTPVTNAFIVSKAAPVLVVVGHDNTTFGNNVIINGTLTGVGTIYPNMGTLTVVINGRNYTADINADGTWNTSFNSTEMDSTGTYDIAVIYSGDGNYTSVTTNSSVTVEKADSKVFVNGNVVIYGNNVTITGSVTGITDVIPTGVVNVTVGNVSSLVNINPTTGTWTLTINSTSVGNVGNYTIAVIYAGDINYTASQNVSEYLNISKVGTSVVVDPVADTIFGFNFTVTGTVTTNNEFGTIPTGSVNIKIGDASVNASLNGGVWIAIFNTIDVGNADASYGINVTYNGDFNHIVSENNSMSFFIAKGGLDSTIIIPDSGSIGDPVVIGGVVTDSNNNKIGNLSVIVTINGNPETVTTNATGEWSTNYTPEHAGNTSISVSYNGSDDYNGFVTAPVILVVNKTETISNVSVSPNTPKFGDPVTVSGVLEDIKGNLLAGKIITVVIGGITKSVTTDANGAWSTTITPSNAGPNNINVNFAGDDDFIGFTEDLTFNVTPDSTKITINVPDNSKVDVTSTISGVLTTLDNKVIANTKITVDIDGIIKNLTTDVNGKWSTAYTPTKAGNVTVKVTFNGTNNYMNSTDSKSFSVTIKKVDIKLQAVSKTIRSFGSGKKLARFKYSFKNFGDKVGSKTYEFKINSRYTLKTPKTTKNIVYSYNKKTRILKVVVKNLNTDVGVISYIIKRNKPVYNGKNTRVSRYTYTNYHPQTVVKAYSVKTVKSHKITKIKVTKNTAYAKEGNTVFSIAESLKTNQKTQTIVYSKKKA